MERCRDHDLLDFVSPKSKVSEKPSSIEELAHPSVAPATRKTPFEECVKPPKYEDSGPVPARQGATSLTERMDQVVTA